MIQEFFDAEREGWIQCITNVIFTILVVRGTDQSIFSMGIMERICNLERFGDSLVENMKGDE